MNDTPDRPPQTAAEARAQAAQHRDRAAAARADAQATQQAARAQADQILADAETRARQLLAEATAADRAAAPLEERAQYLGHAEQLRRQIQDTEQTIAALLSEADDLIDKAEQRMARLDELAEQSETAAVQLTAARERGDVTAVTELRSRVNGINEVAAVVQGHLLRARQRLQEIGDRNHDGGGELNRAENARQGLQAELRRIENILNPDRPEAVHDQLRDDLLLSLTASLERLAVEDKPTVRPAPPRFTEPNRGAR